VNTAAFVVVDVVDVFLDEQAARPGSKPAARPITRQTPTIFNCFPFMILLPILNQLKPVNAIPRNLSSFDYTSRFAVLQQGRLGRMIHIYFKTSICGNDI